MEIITLKINTRTKAGKAFKAVLNFFITQPGVEVVEESPYDAEFVKKIQRARNQKGSIIVDTDDIWGSLGLK